MLDYHLHTHFSGDSEEVISNYIKKAEQIGVAEFCITDHLDLDGVYPEDEKHLWQIDLKQASAELDEIRNSYKGDVKIKKGVEMGLMLHDNIIKRSEEMVSAIDMDFVLLSLHVVDGVDGYYPLFFEGLTKREGFVKYLEYLYKCVCDATHYNSVAHMDYPTKGCPHEDNVLRYSDAPDQIDALFKHLIQNDKCMEINGSILRKIGDNGPDINIYKRYVELGGEYVTLGSDGHSASNMAQSLKKALGIAESAGIKYIAGYNKMKKELHKIQDITVNI